MYPFPIDSIHYVEISGENILVSLGLTFKFFYMNFFFELVCTKGKTIRVSRVSCTDGVMMLQHPTRSDP